MEKQSYFRHSTDNCYVIHNHRAYPYFYNLLFQLQMDDNMLTLTPRSPSGPGGPGAPLSP